MYKAITHSAFACILCAVSFSVSAQEKSFFKSSDTLHKGRLIGVVATETAFITGSYWALQKVWYQNISTTQWHTFDDWPEWQQMDKVGHMYSSYFIGKAGYDLLSWSGVKKEVAVPVGGSLGFLYLFGFEMMDARAQEWGFSWSDVGANALGSGLFMAQQYLWDEQRIKVKFSAHPSPFAQYRPSLLGDSFATRIMKDYNGQTYWLSGNIHSFLKKDSKFPQWLNIAVGYSATGMTGGRANVSVAENGSNIYHQRYRQYLLSLDVDLTKIPVQQHWLKVLLNIVNHIKLPFPTLEFNRNGVRGHWLYF